MNTNSRRTRGRLAALAITGAVAGVMLLGQAVASATTAGGPPAPRKVTRVVQQAAPRVVSHEKPVFIPRFIREGRERVFVDVENRNRNFNRHERRRNVMHRHHDHENNREKNDEKNDENNGSWTGNPEWSEGTSSE
ncbi:hypothetical protein [Nonomuraea jabiensis]|uniref:Uncharacterized protein n=1 Tax=Nonomuraea jabiensis TaxID=882448 RepID=A0A7W9G2I9_9ACTN|nr:hypothetical protein [Nonomuraea jabiensis]MBB5776045.1 hypothetical protein [Nonomuraea jabiensis]